PISQVVPGDAVLVKPGERIPVDGVVSGGKSLVNQSAITGESVPVEKTAGHQVFTGTINEMGALEIKAERVGDDTVLAKIIHLVEVAQDAKAPVERTADRYAKYFVPVVLAAAVLTFIFTKDLIRSVSVLIVACPCALVLATPTAVVAGIGRLALEGILVKGGQHLEQIGKVTCFVFDKTGTLTEGRPRIARVLAFGGRKPADVLRAAATAEQNSEHLLGKLIVEEAKRAEVAIPRLDEFAAMPGLGVTGKCGGRRIIVGNELLMEKAGSGIPPDVRGQVEQLEDEGKTTALVAENGEVIGAIGMEDRLRSDAAVTVARLREIGVRDIVLLTGDHEKVAARIARRAGISEYWASLLPDGKVARVRELQRAGAKVAMLGDGVNDAPSLVTADVGVAMGGIGTDITVDAADIIVMTDELSKLPTAIDLSRRTLKTINENILGFALLFNAAAIAAASGGYIKPVSAAVVHQVSSLLVVLNSLRLLAAGRVGRMARRAVLQRTLEPVWMRRRQVLAWSGALAVALYVASGFYAVQPEQVGIVRRFGKKLAADAQPGLHYRVPWPVDTVVKVDVGRIRNVEIGYRTLEKATGQEPAAHEWNVQHLLGRYERRPDESAVITGDENILEMNFVVQYSVVEPSAYLFALTGNPDDLVRSASEAAIRRAIGTRTIEQVLTSDIEAIQSEVKRDVESTAELCGLGIAVKAVCVEAGHPPFDVVDAFRDVASARQDKERAMNEAQTYANETVALARGSAVASTEAATGYTKSKVSQATGDADKFLAVSGSYRESPEVTRTRLFLETMETSLAGLRKVIVDSQRVGKNQFMLLRGAGAKEKLKPLLEAKPQTQRRTEEARVDE
ncbi:MAG: FtsH protease activity modulator HflK, partial [Planctomycetes bacterium]|nr:FtsH protease activity modulator HflK [Planctomycetota bacterium]